MIIAWFSCGATSAVACKLAIKKYPDVIPVYIETGSSHPDNTRFLRDCENWFGIKIQQLQSETYNSVADVIRKTKWVNSPYGASCTLQLKKNVRRAYEKKIGNWEHQIFGFDFCRKEINRAIRFKQQNPATKPLFPLIDAQLTKTDALAIVKKAGIELPIMYSLGYQNNNCIGCVKGGISYWNKIRQDFPETFRRMAQLEREVNSTCLKDEHGPLYLDTLDPRRGLKEKPLAPDCSLFCEIEFENIIDPQTEILLRNKTTTH